jgi:hypothetical protein
MRDNNPQTIQEMGDEFMRFLGMCITEWAQIEEELFESCHAILRTKKEHTAIIYYRTPTLASRLELVSELITTVFPLPKSGDHPSLERRTWKEIHDDFERLLPERNLLAHSPVGPTITNTNGDWLNDIRYESYTHRNERMRGKSAKGPMTLEDLRKHISSLVSLWSRLRTFRHALPAHVAKL